MLQAAELLFGPAGRPHDYLQEALFRLLAVGFVGAASQNWILKVQHVLSDWHLAASHTPENVMSAITPSGAESGQTWQTAQLVTHAPVRFQSLTLHNA